MRISLWQQFSSNHSSNFTVVGEFQSPDLAREAADKLRQAAKAISDWYRSHEDVRWQVVERGNNSPTEAELQICQQYGLNCDKALEWLANCGYAEDCVASYDNYAFVQPLVNGEYCESWTGEALFDQLMAKLGGKVTVDESHSGIALTTITCLAPNDTAAQIIVWTAHQYLMRDQDTTPHLWTIIPWIAYHSGQRDPQADQLIQLEKMFVARKNAERLRKDLSKYPELSPEHYQWVMDASIATEASFWWQDEDDNGVYLNQRTITLGKMRLSQISTALPAIVAWLKDQGCTEIQYKVEQD